MRRLILAAGAVAVLASAIPADAGRLRDMIKARREARQPEQDVKGGTEYRYGRGPKQALDYWPAASRTNALAPLVIFVHGGGWKNGDKSNATGQYKAPHYTGLGYAFASINYGLLPEVPVEQQAADVAKAVAYLKSNATRLGFDPNQIVLMGHSAGAHLVALVGTDPNYLRAAGLTLDALKGVIPLDGACYDVPAQMSDGPKRMQDTYRDAFGTEPGRQRALSPTFHAASPNAPSFLILHVERDDGARQSAGLADALRKGGTPVQLKGFAGKGLVGHLAINRSLGNPAYPATPVVDAWLQQVFAR
jgi:arylformamidase